MQTAINTELINFKDWVLRVRPSASLDAKLLVMLHGWTGDENSMWVFTKRLSSKYWIIAPRAPYEAESKGFSWRPLHPETFGRPSLERLLPAAKGLIHLIDEYAASVKLEARQFDLMGFSQGGAMVNVMGMLYPERVNKMAVLAGFLPSGLEDALESQVLLGKNVFVAHGTQDELVPLERARASMEGLERAGAQLTFCEDEVGHKLSSNCLRALEAYLEN